uniref:Uncharacterized protein n=1 Tax=Oncorhynchus tshawytscha TaxID=74940 RepID=A0A8C8IE68_ONCTS
MRSVCWSTASWRQQTGVCVRLHTPQDTNTPILSTPEVTGHALKGSTESVTRYCRRRGCRVTKTALVYTQRLSRTRLRLCPVRSGVPPGWRGLCNGRPANSTPGEDLRETTRGCSILITEQHFHLSLGLFTLAGFTDVLGGYIASNWASRKSILISVFYISLPYTQLIPGLLLVIVRDVDLIAAVSYVRYKTVPPPICGVALFILHLSVSVFMCLRTCMQVNTAIQLFLVAASLASSVFHFRQYITQVTTTVSGYSYCHYGMKTLAVLNSTK